MAKMVLLASYLSLNAADRSANTNKIELQTEVDEQDMTTFASLGWKEVLGGIKSGSLGAEFKQDTAAAALDAVMWPLFGLVIPFEVRLDNAAVSASNPKYTGSVLVKTWTPISGNVGDGATVSVSWPTSGVVARAVV
jgi:hypothetical protein